MTTTKTKTFYAEGKKFTIRSRGTRKNGKLNGKGSTTMFNEEGVKVKEERGNFINDIFNGKGEIIHYDGDGRKERTERGTFRCGILKDGERVDQVKRTKEEIRKEMEERIMKEEKDVDKIL